jgi:AhpD family alkylhydroperoxidase
LIDIKPAGGLASYIVGRHGHPEEPPMPDDPRQTAQAVIDGAAQLKQAVPAVMEGFAALGGGTYKPGALEPKAKELIALAISITVRCDGCVAYHARAAHNRGASRAEVAEAIGVAIHMGGGPSMVYGAEALRAYDTFAGAAG